MPPPTDRPVASERLHPDPGPDGPLPRPGAAGSGPHHPDHPGCFGCGPTVSGGLRVDLVRLDTGDASADFTCTVEPVWAGAPGRTHGGVLSAILDEALGRLLWALGHRCATARLEVDYRSPVPVGSTLHVSARRTAVRGRKIYAEALARLGDPVDAGAPAGRTAPVAVRAAALYLLDRRSLPPEPDGSEGEGGAVSHHAAEA